jgi:hypothetical protein
VAALSSTGDAICEYKQLHLIETSGKTELFEELVSLRDLRNIYYYPVVASRREQVIKFYTKPEIHTDRRFRTLYSIDESVKLTLNSWSMEVTAELFGRVLVFIIYQTPDFLRFAVSLLVRAVEMRYFPLPDWIEEIESTGLHCSQVIYQSTERAKASWLDKRNMDFRLKVTEFLKVLDSSFIHEILSMPFPHESFYTAINTNYTIYIGIKRKFI